MAMYGPEAKLKHEAQMSPCFRQPLIEEVRLEPMSFSDNSDLPV